MHVQELPRLAEVLHRTSHGVGQAASSCWGIKPCHDEKRCSGMLRHLVAASQMKTCIPAPLEGGHNEVCQALPIFEGVLIITCPALHAAPTRCWLTRHLS